MLELLRLWEKLEPGRCCFVRSMSVQIWLNDGPQNVHISSCVGRAVIQAAVQEAIEARDWTATLYTTSSEHKDYSGRFHSMVTVPGDDPGDMPYHLRQARGDVAAQVLLDAYLQALEARLAALEAL